MRSSLARHLYLRIWLAVVLAIALLTGLLGALWHWQWAQDRDQRPGREVVVRNADGEWLGQAPLKPVRVPGQGLEFQVTLRDGEQLHILLPRPGRPRDGQAPSSGWAIWQSPFGVLGLMALLALGVALGVYPVVRRLTQRLERLQKGVEQWGEGDLSVRMPVEGEDEVAFLARRFNRAAERVEALLGAHRALLANASHELRTPLARIRMGLELLASRGDDPLQRAELTRNINELDELVGELLLASRLQAAEAGQVGALEPEEPVDWLGLVAEEAARAGVSLVLGPGGPPGLLQGQPKLLRRLVRNLLDNARRHGGGDIEVEVGQVLDPGRPMAELVVRDRGPGVPADQRERIFEPFHRVPGRAEPEGSVGLGLSLVRGIARRHGGEVQCLPRAGGGSCFVVRLPVAAEAPISSK